MSIITQTKNLLSLPKSLIATQKRFSVREKIHRYVEPHRYKKHMLAATQPYFRRKYELPSETCKGTSAKTHEMGPLEKIYAEELIEEVKKNDFVLFVQHNYTPFQSERVYKNTLIKSGGTFYNRKNPVYEEVFNTLGIKEVQHLFVTRNSLVLGPLDKLNSCVRALRKMPQFLLLAGCIDQEVYTYHQLQTIAATDDIDQCRANLLATLNTPAIELSMILEHISSQKTEDT